MIMHGNAGVPRRVRPHARSGMPAREAMTELPRAAFELMDRVYREGRPLARRLALPAAEHRLVVVPRMDPETGETYGVTTHLRLQDPPAPAARVRAVTAECRGVVDRARRLQPHADRRLRGVAAARRLRRRGVPRPRARGDLVVRVGRRGPRRAAGRAGRLPRASTSRASRSSSSATGAGEHQRPLRRLPPPRHPPDDARPARRPGERRRRGPVGHVQGRHPLPVPLVVLRARRPRPQRAVPRRGGRLRARRRSACTRSRSTPGAAGCS